MINAGKPPLTDITAKVLVCRLHFGPSRTGRESGVIVREEEGRRTAYRYCGRFLGQESIFWTRVQLIDTYHSYRFMYGMVTPISACESTTTRRFLLRCPFKVFIYCFHLLFYFTNLILVRWKPGLSLRSSQKSSIILILALILAAQSQFAITSPLGEESRPGRRSSNLH
jgi:hypothetical protein